MAYKAKAIIYIEFPEARTLEEANLTYNIWLDLIAPVLKDRVVWEEVWGDKPYEEND